MFGSFSSEISLVTFWVIFTHIGRHVTDIGRLFADFGRLFADFGRLFTDIGRLFADFGQFYWHKLFCRNVKPFIIL